MPQSWASRGDIRDRPQPVEAPAAPVPFWGAVQRNYEDGWETRRRNARYEATDGALWDRHREIERRLGRRLQLSRSLAGVTPGAGEQSLLDRITFDPEAINAAILGRPGLLDDEAYEALIEAERAKNPALFEGIERREELAARLDAQFRETRARADAASGSGWQGAAGGFVGQIGAYMSDPANAGTAVATGGFGAGRPLLTRMLAQGAVGGTQEALEVGARAQDAERFGGPEYTAREAALDVTFGAAGGAGFEGLGSVGMAAWRATARRLGGSAEPTERGLSHAIERLLDDEAALGGVDDFDGAQAALARGEPRPAPEPELDLEALFADRPSGPVSRPQPDAPAGAASGPVRASQGGSGAPDAGLVSTDYRGRRIWAGQFDPLALEVDAARFQFKADGDAAGVTSRLRGVEQWDATASGKVLVFEDLDGTRFIADGHQRRGLAARLAEQGFEGAMLDGHLLRAADGWTPREARIVAAMKNLREGSGTIMDAAKLLREAPGAIRDKSLPVTGEFITQARQLAGLSDDAFRAVVNGVIPERYGAVLGEMAGDRPEMHGQLVGVLKKGQPGSLDGARALVQEALLDDFIATEGVQLDMFGDLPRESTLFARAKIREQVMAQLRRDQRTFGLLVRNADAIQAGGNVLATDANAQRLALDRAAGEMVSRLALRSGEMGEAFTKAAEGVTLGTTTVAAAVKGLTARIRAAAKAGELEDMARAERLNPAPPTEGALAAAKTFAEPGGLGQKAQIEPKPEDAALEASWREGIPDEDLAEAMRKVLETGEFEGGLKANAAGLEWAQAQLAEAEARMAAKEPPPPSGLFDDLPDEEGALERALTHLRACAPGGA